MVNRRDVARQLAAGCFLLSRAATPTAAGQDAADPAAGVRRVLVAFKCHLDLGFTQSQQAVLRRYFDQHIPRAISIAAAMRQSGDRRYVWTMGSWLLYEYLEQANSEQRGRMEQAIASGDIAWHALPFTWQTELMDRSMIAGAIGICRSLDRRFGRRTTGAKMTDVPGHSRGLIGPLAENGVTFLDIGVNSGSTPPEVPPLFLWKDPGGQSLVIMYHRTYGGIVRAPRSDLAAAVIVRRGDNSGPHTMEQIRAIYADLERQFPQAQVRAANLTEIAAALEPLREKLPVITQEIGDTWIYGVSSDPVKIARFRELSRLRSEWIARGRFACGDATDVALLRKLALAAEHTWGTDTKSRLDFENYRPADLARVISQPNYRLTEAAWAEKRGNLDQCVLQLPPGLRVEAERRISGLRPAAPTAGALRTHDPGRAVEGAHFIVRLDGETGAIHRLYSKATRREWASAKSPLALFSYQTLSQSDYTTFIARYVVTKAAWAYKDFGKPNIEKFGAVSRIWTPRLVQCRVGREGKGSRIVSELRMADEVSERAGLVAWPARIYVEIVLPDSEPVVLVNFSWFDKPATRLPEAMWITYRPDASEKRGWMLDKVDRPVSPFDVVAGGNRHMHALRAGLRYRDARDTFSIDSLDAPVIALGERSPIAFSNTEPELSQGIHFCLFNNAWGTNYVQWFREDMRFRFRLRVS